MNRDEEVIDVMKFVQIFWAKKFTVIDIIAMCMVVAAFIGMCQLKLYESTYVQIISPANLPSDSVQINKNYMIIGAIIGSCLSLLYVLLKGRYGKGYENS